MTRHGGKIPDVAPEAIRRRLPEATDAKAVKRLVVAREYLAGRTPAEIESKYGFPEQTVYDWLDRIEERGLDAALVDDRPPGRAPTLAGERRRRFERAVRRPPEEAGFDAPAWTPALAGEFLRESFGVSFSRRHVRRLLAEVDGARLE